VGRVSAFLPAARPPGGGQGAARGAAPRGRAALSPCRASRRLPPRRQAGLTGGARRQGRPRRRLPRGIPAPPARPGEGRRGRLGRGHSPRPLAAPRTLARLSEEPTCRHNAWERCRPRGPGERPAARQEGRVPRVVRGRGAEDGWRRNCHRRGESGPPSRTIFPSAGRIWPLRGRNPGSPLAMSVTRCQCVGRTGTIVAWSVSGADALPTRRVTRGVSGLAAHPRWRPRPPPTQYIPKLGCFFVQNRDKNRNISVMDMEVSPRWPGGHAPTLPGAFGAPPRAIVPLSTLAGGFFSTSSTGDGEPEHSPPARRTPSTP